MTEFSQIDSRIDVMLSKIRKILNKLHRDLRSGRLEKHAGPLGLYAKYDLHLSKGEKKEMLLVDKLVENLFKKLVEDQFKKLAAGAPLNFFGEEVTQTNDNLPYEDRICVLADIMDGTDLFEMGLPSWCSAVLLFQSFRDKKRKPRILGAVVALATGETYVASITGPVCVYRKPMMDSLDGAEVGGPSKIDALQDARIAFYGQKAKNMLSVIRSPRIINRLRDFEKKEKNKEAVSFRLYNFAGNPLMAKLVDRNRDEKGKLLNGIDAIFEASGQKLHDFVPGAFIALRAGASLFDLSGEEITIEMLGEKLVKPMQRMKYVLAATKPLGIDLCAALHEHVEGRSEHYGTIPTSHQSPTGPA